MGRHMLAKVALGFVFSGSVACGTAVTPALVQCKLAALRTLPSDPEQATVADARDLVSRLQACHAPSDGGTP